MTDRSIRRRVFVKAGGLALVSMGLDPIFLTRAAYAVHRGNGPANRKKTLVCVFQRGAVDGLNMIVPHGEAVYYRERPRIAVATPGSAEGALDLDGHFGLHPALAPLLPLYRDGALAVVHAVGSHQVTRSHFDALEYMESGTPGIKATRDGWLGRYLHHDRSHRDTPFRGVAFGNRLPQMLESSAPTLAIRDLAAFGIRGRPAVRDRFTSAFEQLYAGDESGLVASSSEEAFEAMRMLRTVEPARRAPAHGAQYPASRFGRTMRQVAQLIHADLGLEIAFADVDGWDTHVNQGAGRGQLAGRLDDFARALRAFTTDLGRRMADVVVLTMSEFGRTVAENGSGGTDHGHGTAMFVMGGLTQGGRVHGHWPSLDPSERFEGRDLAVTTDFRDLFGEVLVKHLGAADLNAVFPGHRSNVGTWLGVMGG